LQQVAALLPQQERAAEAQPRQLPAPEAARLRPDAPRQDGPEAPRRLPGVVLRQQAQLPPPEAARRQGRRAAWLQSQAPAAAAHSRSEAPGAAAARQCGAALASPPSAQQRAGLQVARRPRLPGLLERRAGLPEA
jgi:hypothetical protein